METKIEFRGIVIDNANNDGLKHILECCQDANIKNLAAKMLRVNLGLPDNNDERALIQKIAKQVLATPQCLNMGNWHCGTTHCLAGWATILDTEAKQVEEQTGSTEIAGCATIPSLAQYFYKDNNTVLEMLKKL